MPGDSDVLQEFVKGTSAGVPSIAMGRAPSDNWSGGTGNRLGALIEAQVSHDKVQRAKFGKQPKKGNRRDERAGNSSTTNETHKERLLNV